MADDGAAGFALRRNGTCLATEESCGPTRAPFSACCPSGSICSNPYNQVCCPSASNCTTAIVQQPVCGEPSWNLYNNGGVEGGYFCCVPTSFGYAATLTDSSGCGDEEYELGSGEAALQLLNQAQAATTSSISGSTQTSATSGSQTTTTESTPSSQSPPSGLTTAPAFESTTASAEPSSSGGNNSSATIGGAVGGAAAAVILLVVVFFLFRRRRRIRKQRDGPHEIYDSFAMNDKSRHQQPSELPSSTIAELASPDASDSKSRQSRPVELP